MATVDGKSRSGGRQPRGAELQRKHLFCQTNSWSTRGKSREEDAEVDDHTSDNQQPGPTPSEGPKPKKRNPNWGGRRPGAGAPKGNLNGFKHGGRSRQLGQAVKTLAENPRTRDTLVALARRAGLEQAKAEEVAARFFINAIPKGVKINNPEQARALTDLIRELSR